ncbi:Transcriptional regulator, GntR family [[Clostridium] ultunense Esp]|nr:Transcriptional regulator, GntR family [[Clostridium] ultunense Esp]
MNDNSDELLIEGRVARSMRIILSNASELPIYDQIIRQIKQAIVTGELKTGEMLPSIRTLAKELQISVITTKRAYDELEKEGYLYSVPGKGTFVAAENLEMLREARVKIVEEKLAEAVTAAKGIDLSLDDLLEMVKILYVEG